MSSVVDLLDRPVYGMGQVDRLLALTPGTAGRWIDGYTRSGIRYGPVVRPERTGQETVTWGEFVEARLLAGYRAKGVPLIRMRPAILRLREEFGTRYPLAHARPYVADRELVRLIQEEVRLDHALHIVVIRNGQQMLTPPASGFLESVEFEDGVVSRLRPFADIEEIVIDPLRRFGEPVVRDRSVPTEVIAEQYRVGESQESIAELYELTSDQVRAAIQYELRRIQPIDTAA